jgi:hypothetical protein
MYGAWWGALLSREVAECQRYTGASGRGITHRSSTLERAVSPSSVRGVKRASCSSTLRGRASVRVASCVIAVFKSVYFTRIHTGSLRVYTRWLPPRSPPRPRGRGGAPARGRLGLWGELVSRDASRVSSLSTQLTRPPGGFRPRYSQNVVFPVFKTVLFKSCYYQYYKSLVFSLCSFESGDTVRAHLLITLLHTPIQTTAPGGPSD